MLSYAKGPERRLGFLHCSTILNYTRIQINITFSLSFTFFLPLTLFCFFFPTFSSLLFPFSLLLPPSLPSFYCFFFSFLIKYLNEDRKQNGNIRDLTVKIVILILSPCNVLRLVNSDKAFLPGLSLMLSQE